MVVSGAVEGIVDEAVVMRLLERVGGEQGAVYGKAGKHNLLQDEPSQVLLELLFYASQPNSGLRTGLLTVGPPGASGLQVHRDPVLHSLDTGRAVSDVARG